MRSIWLDAPCEVACLVPLSYDTYFNLLAKRCWLQDWKGILI